MLEFNESDFYQRAKTLDDTYIMMEQTLKVLPLPLWVEDRESNTLFCNREYKHVTNHLNYNKDDQFYIPALGKVKKISIRLKKCGKILNILFPQDNTKD